MEIIAVKLFFTAESPQWVRSRASSVQYSTEAAVAV